MALDLSARAIALAEATGDELTMIHALNTQGSEAAGTGDPAGFEILDQARLRAERGGYRFEEARALINMASVAADLRQIERAAELAQRARDVAARYEIRALETYAQAHIAEVLLWKGDWDASEDTAREVLGSHPHVESLVGRVLGTLQARRGNPEAKDTLERSWKLAVASGEIQHMGPTGAGIAEYMWLAGEPDPDRLALLREVVGRALRGNYPWAAGDLALWLWKLGELSEAPDGISEPQRLVIDGEARAAADLWEGIGCPYDQAIALMHGDGHARLRALEIFETLGAAATASKLRKALREEGVAVPRGRSRKTREHAANLTARQAEILQLLAEDLTNSQIADRLFVSPRTVEHHVSAVLGKLGESTRAEAVSRARRDGLLELKDR